MTEGGADKNAFVCVFAIYRTFVAIQISAGGFASTFDNGSSRDRRGGLERTGRRQ